MRQLLLTVLLAVTAFPLQAASGLTFDGSTDYLDCGVINFDLADDYANIVLWIRPAFASSDANTYTIIDNNNFGANQGFRFEWRGSTSNFRFSLGGTAFNRSCELLSTFSSGDLLGIFASVANNVQNCESRNVNTNNYVTGSAFAGIAFGASANNTIIGAIVGAASQFYPGDIYQIVLTNTRIKNSNHNQLDTFRLPFFQYTWPGNLPTQADARVDYIAAWDFSLGNAGTALANPAVIVDRQGTHDCTVNGTPVAVGSPMLR